MSINEPMNYEQSSFNPQFSPCPHDGRLWRACWAGRCGVGMTQTEAVQQLRKILIAAGIIKPGEGGGKMKYITTT